MNLSAPFIARPVATTLLTIGIAVAGILSFFRLPVSTLPQVDFPTISVQAQLPGASPETVATRVENPLERRLGKIAGVTEMTSQGDVGQTRIVLQFGLDRDIDGTARDVQAAINAAHADLPTSLKTNPTYWEVQSSRTFSKARGCAAARVGRACDSRCQNCPILVSLSSFVPAVVHHHIGKDPAQSVKLAKVKLLDCHRGSCNA